MNIVQRFFWILALGTLLTLLTGCGTNEDGSEFGRALPQQKKVFTEVGVNERHTPQMWQLTHEGHTYLVIGNGINEGFILHSESCPHPIHPGMGEIY